MKKDCNIFIIICLIICSSSFAEIVIEIHDDTVLPHNYVFEGILNIYDTPPDTTSIQIQSGYINYVNSYNSSEVVNFGSNGNIWHFHDNSSYSMYGGEIGWIQSLDYSQMTIYGGTIGQQISATGSSLLNYFEGDTGWLNSLGTAEVNIDGGRVREGISSNDSSVININDGGAYWMQTYGNSTVNLRNASFGFFGSSDESIVNVYGRNLALTTTGGRGFGYVTGEWGNGANFNIPFFAEETYTHVILHEIPEPTTLSLLAIGALMLRRKKYSNLNKQR